MKIEYRPAEERDLEQVHYAMVETLDQMALERGNPTEERDLDDYLPLWRHFLGSSGGGFWVAEVKGRLAGFACSVSRDGLWFLSYLVVLPEFQGQGISEGLLVRVLEEVQKMKPEIMAGYADASDWASVSLYASNGIFPRMPVLRMMGSLSTITLLPESGAPSFEVARLSEEAVKVLGAIDHKVRGTYRYEDHRFWLGVASMCCYVFHERKKPFAYVYTSSGGRLGPMATLKGEHTKAILDFALLRMADQGVDTFRVRVPGSNTEALSLFYERGFTIQELHLIMSSVPFGHWENYIISRPSLL